ncbi:hypothetical protein SAMN05216391_11627 [Lachnospiraceae bacterium KHCPX20]|nr:hypothetical protein SAMN05216391_11627 [Lachnospiraceae bacterium KHCPX20]
MIDGEYKKILKQYHKLSDRHILVAETDMPYSDPELPSFYTKAYVGTATSIIA